MTVGSDEEELELFIDGEQVTEIPDLVFGDQVIVARARNCADVCSEWVVSERIVTVAESPGAADINFTSLSPYTGQLEISSLAEEVEAALNGERVLAGLVAVVGGDVLTVRTRNCSGADVCSPWDDASHEVSVDAAPDAADSRSLLKGRIPVCWRTRLKPMSSLPRSTGMLSMTSHSKSLVAKYCGLRHATVVMLRRVLSGWSLNTRSLSLTLLMLLR